MIGAQVLQVRRDARVVTMDPDLGDIARADIHVSQGTIRDISPDLPGAKDALVVDAGACQLVAASDERLMAPAPVEAVPT